MATNVTLKGAEVVGNMTGKAMMSLATFLIAAARSEKRTKGRTRMKTFNGKPTKVFIIRLRDLPEFAKQAREYGVLYAAVINRKDRTPDGLVDVVVNAHDAGKVNRIAERFAMSAVDVDRVRDELLQTHEDTSDQALDNSSGQTQERGAKKQRTTLTDEQAFTVDEETLSQMVGDPHRQHPQTRHEDAQNPMRGRTERARENPSAPTYERNNRSETTYEQERPSLRGKIEDMKQERRDTAQEQRQPQRQQQRHNQHRQPNTRRNTRPRGGR